MSIAIQKHVKNIIDTIEQGSIEKRARASLHLVTLPKGIEEGIKRVVYQAQYFFKQMQKESLAPPLYKRVLRPITFLFDGIEIVFLGLGITNLFSTPRNQFEASYRVHNMMFLYTLLSPFVMVLATYMAASVLQGLIAAGSIFAVLAIGFLYVKFFKPPPKTLFSSENWTEQAQRGTLQKTDGRKETVARLGKLLSTRHVLLIGQSRVGKTQAIKDFVYAIERGDFPELKGKKLFYINTADLALQSIGMWGDGNEILQKISDSMGARRQDVILVFDEIHLACKEGKSSIFGEKLKTRLDQGETSFPYVIGLTTAHEYATHVYRNQPAFDERFAKITLESMGKDEVIMTMRNIILQEHPHVLIDQGALEALFTKSSEAFSNDPQPIASLRILTEVVRRIEQKEMTALENQIVELEQELASLQSVIVESIDPFSEAPDTSSIQDQIAQLKNERVAEKKVRDSHYNARKTFAELKKRVYELALEIEKKPDDAKKKLLYLYSHFLLPQLKEKLIEDAQKLGLHVTISENLISEVIEQEIKTRKARQAELVSGQNLEKERAAL